MDEIRATYPNDLELTAHQLQVSNSALGADYENRDRLLFYKDKYGFLIAYLYGLLFYKLSTLRTS